MLAGSLGGDFLTAEAHVDSLLSHGVGGGGGGGALSPESE